MEVLFQNFSQYLHQTSPLAYLISFLGGVGASLTPCVYPLLPILVGVIGAKTGSSRRRGFFLSVTFVLGMAVTYCVLGMAAALTGQIFGQLTTHPVSYLLVGNLCLLFGIAMLGFFELKLPGRWGHARPGHSQPGVVPVFLMGAGSGVVAAPCTVPVLGALLTFVAQSRNVIFGTSLLFVFALGLGFLLILVGTFTGLIASLPKSGAWLDGIKKSFGILLIIAAEYFILQAGRQM